MPGGAAAGPPLPPPPFAAQRGRSRASTLRLCHGALRDLRWWRSLETSPDVGRALWPKYLGCLTTDASPYGWGGHWEGFVPACGFFTLTDLPNHINVKEVDAMTNSLLAMHQHYPVRDGAIDLRIDSRVAMSCINAFSSRSPALTAALHRLYTFCRSLGLTTRASWIASVANLWADRLSRDRDRSYWRLCPRVFNRLELLFGPHEVDLFATSLDTHCARFYSFPASPGCDGINELAQCWAMGNHYASPPFSQIEPTLAKIGADSATVTLILPVWQDQPWGAEALGRSNEAFLLPRSAGLYGSGQDQLPKKRPHWRAAAFRFHKGGKPWPTTGERISDTPWPTQLAEAALPLLPSPTSVTCL